MPAGFITGGAVAILAAALAGCGRGPSGAPVLQDTIAELVPSTDTGMIVASAPPSRPSRRLTPLADSIAQRLVFVPATQAWFVGAVRERHLGIDVGRVDIDLQRGAGRREAFRTAVEALSPVAIGASLRLRGPWGEEDAEVTGFEAVGGRVLARLKLSPLADSVIRGTPVPLVTAQRVDSLTEPRPAACDRTVVDDSLTARLSAVADSLMAELRAGELPVYARLQKSLRSRHSHVAGCFGEARGVVLASLWAGDYEWARERAVLVSDSSVTPVAVRDLRFRSHELLMALDGDGDGVDDVAARAWTPRGSGTVVLRFADGVRLERLAAGFAIER